MNYPYKNLENFTLPKLLERSVELYASRDALGEAGGAIFSYKKLGEKVNATAAMLQHHGIKKGGQSRSFE